jgi:hypothetical protein
MKILVKLERVSPTTSDPDAPEDEELELRHWADLREYQTKFAQEVRFLTRSCRRNIVLTDILQGGFLGVN